MPTSDDSPRRFRLTKAQKLRTPAEFDRVYERKQKVGDDALLLFAAPNELGTTRFGLSVSRKQGNAVRRARLKRLLREAFRLQQYRLPAGIDVVLIPRQGFEGGLREFSESLVRLSRRVARRFNVQQEGDA